MSTVARQYAVALASVAVALALRWALNPWLEHRVPFITLFGAVIVAAWYGGAAPAALTAVLGWFGAEVFFVEPRGTFSWRGGDQVVELIAYFTSTLLIAALGGVMRRLRAQAEGSEQRFRAFVENSPVAVFIKDESLRYVFANRAAEHALGSTQWEGRTDLDLLPAAAAERVRENDRQVLDSGSPQPFDLAVTRPDGERRYHSTKFPLTDADGRRYVGVVSVDITGQKRSEEELQLVTDAMSVAVIRCSSDAHVLWMNRIFCHWLGVAPREVIGRPLHEVFGTDVMAEIRPYIERVLKGEAVTYERFAAYPALGPRWLAASYTPTADGGWVGVVYDIHRHRQMEEALRAADRRKDEFLATLAHELRNPLAPIRNAVALLERKASPDPDLAWSRDLIRRQVAQMTRLIDDLLDVARISSGKLALRRERMPLALALDMALETSRPNLEEAGLALDVAMPPKDHLVDGDATRLAQVFANLLNNAARYTDRGGRVRVEAFAEDGKLGVRVADTGIGFPQDLADQIFEPFAQIEPAAGGRGGGGLGIGLALARGIVTLHGGGITAKSAGLGRGSEFVVRLPRAAPRGAPRETPGAAASASPVRGLRVVVADDNRDAADSLARILGLYGHEVRVAYDGASAIEVGRAFRPEAAVLDIGMPGTNGYDVARALRQALGPSVTLIALTGWGQAADRQRAAEAGFDHHLTKPTDPGTVGDLLARVAGR